MGPRGTDARRVPKAMAATTPRPARAPITIPVLNRRFAGAAVAFVGGACGTVLCVMTRLQGGVNSSRGQRAGRRWRTSRPPHDCAGRADADTGGGGGGGGGGAGGGGGRGRGGGGL